MNKARGANSGPPPSLVIAGILIVALGVLVVFGSLTVLQLPRPVTEQGDRIEKLYWATLAISMVIYFGVTAGIIWAIFRYRRRAADEMPAQVHGSTGLEIGWTVVPAIILVALFIPSLILVIDLRTPPAAAEVDVEMEVIGRQWWWEFVYCDAGDCERATNVRIQSAPPNYAEVKESPPRIIVPVGKTVRMKVRSADVVHSFYAPRFLYKIQAIPGNVNELHFTVKEPGVYVGQCYQFCGLRHSDMLFVIEARSPADFQRWLTEQKRAQKLPPQESAETTDERATGR